MMSHWSHACLDQLPVVNPDVTSFILTLIIIKREKNVARMCTNATHFGS